MIIDTMFPKKYEIYSEKFTLKPWQKGIVSELLSWNDLNNSGIKIKLDKHLMKSVNMGPQAGHTYLARALSLVDFPMRTKVYVTNGYRLGEYGDLVLKPQRCHELVDVMHDTDFVGYHGDPVDLVVIDLANEPMSKFKNAMKSLTRNLPVHTLILILQSGLPDFADLDQIML